jgi:hypothetical protein
VLREEAVLEAVDDVLVGDVCDGGLHLEETPGVGPQGLIHLMLDLGQIVASVCSDHGSLEVVDEGLLEVLPRVDGVWFEAFEPSEGRGFQGHREIECLGGVGSPGDVDGNRVATNPLAWVLLAVILGDPDWFKILGVEFVTDVGGEGGEAVIIIVIVVPVGMVPSPCLDDAPRVTAIIDLLPKINRGSIVKASLGWRCGLRTCVTLVARWATGLLYLLFAVATRRLLSLVVLAVVVPPVPGPPQGVRLICVVSPWCLEVEGLFRVEDTECCLSSCTSVRWVRYYSPCI